MPKAKWIIVWCEEDSSYSLIDEKEAVFDEETLTVGDQLNFFFCNKEYVGVVREIGDDDQYELLVKRLGELNASNRKREVSFHGDMPRKTRGKGKFRDALDALKSKRLKPIPAKSCPSTQASKASKPLAQLMDAVSTDTDTDEAPSSSANSSPIPEDLSQIVQHETKQLNRTLAAKGKVADLKALHRSAKTSHRQEVIYSQSQPVKHRLDKNNNQSQSTGELPCCSRETDAGDPSGGLIAEPGPSSGNVKDAQNITHIPIFVDSSDEEQPNPPVKRKRSKAKDSSRQQKKAPIDNTGSEESIAAKDPADPMETKEVVERSEKSVLRYSKDDDDVVQLKGRSKNLSHVSFYIASKELQTARMAINASMFAKRLLVGAFTDKALLTCTVSGGEYRAGGSANIRRKPALDQDVVAVIIETALGRQDTKKWKPEYSKKEILQGLRQKLVDIRPRLKKAALLTA